MSKLLSITSLYEKFCMFILHLLNYNNIENTHGTYHAKINGIDFLFTLIYFVFSVWKLKTVTQVVFWTNFIVLLRMLIKNTKSSLNLRWKYKKIHNKKAGILYKSPYDIILLFDVPIILVFVVILFITGFPFSNEIVLCFAFFVLLLSFLEHCVSIIAEVFEASVELRQFNI